MLLRAYLTPKGWRIEFPRVSPSNLTATLYKPAFLDRMRADGLTVPKRLRPGAPPAVRIMPNNVDEWPDLDFTLVCAHHGPKEIHYGLKEIHGEPVGVALLRSDIRSVIATHKPVARVLPDLLT